MQASRILISSFLFCILATTVVAKADEPKRPPQLGFLSFIPRPDYDPSLWRGRRLDRASAVTMAGIGTARSHE